MDKARKDPVRRQDPDGSEESPANELTDALATESAVKLRTGFLAYNEEFRAITRRARQRFEQRDWIAGRADAVERIELYDNCVRACVTALLADLGDRSCDRKLWKEIKSFFSVLVLSEPDGEFFKTYFNSVTRQIFGTVGADPEFEFVGSEATPLRNIEAPVACRSYVREGAPEDMFRSLLADFAWSVPYEDAEASATQLAAGLANHYREHEDNDSVLCIEVIEQVFYRDTRAYLVGKATGWNRTTPLVIAFENTERGIRNCAVVQSRKDLSALFGYTRSYFHVDLESVGAAIVYLRSLMPRKKTNEIFTVLGRAKQGKTERYRDFTNHLTHAKDRFIIAPGDLGLVMIVFTLPSYDIVFKVIRDEFGASKNTTREKVKQSYELVFHHDKGGRLVDAQEFRRMRFHRSRFAPDLLDALLTQSSETTWLEGDDVVFHHVYVERRLRPLNLYLREAGPEATRRAVLEYGQAIRDLAATNIFPGDLLLKNFGVGRHGRAVFYDYDELCLLTQCNFRALPEPRTHEEEMSAEPWYHVAGNDVFPEEFASFLGLAPEMKKVFTEAHGDLLTPEFWIDLQERIRAGEILDVLPF